MGSSFFFLFFLIFLIRIKWFPKNFLLNCTPTILMLLGGVIVYAFDLKDVIKTPNNIIKGFYSPSIPEITFSRFYLLIFPSCEIAIVSYMEGLLITKKFAQKVNIFLV